MINTSKWNNSESAVGNCTCVASFKHLSHSSSSFTKCFATAASSNVGCITQLTVRKFSNEVAPLTCKSHNLMKYLCRSFGLTKYTLLNIGF